MTSGDREMAHWLRVRVALPEDHGLIPSIHRVAHKHLQLQFQGTGTFFWLP